jgi:histidinol dehydrogenase
MAERLRATCERQMPAEWQDMPAGDGFVGELIRPIRRVGVYVPGGRAAYPSTVVMAAIPARVAGVGTVAVATPPNAGGGVSEAVLAACAVAGITEVYRVGGAQAIAALAYGTATIRPVDKIVGPGNIYVTVAKRLVSGWVGTDADAGPTEIAIIADGSASAEVIAADLVAQAEHGPLGTHALITWVPELADRVMSLLELEVARHERPDDVENALIEGGRAVLVRDRKHALETANALAPEHLELIFEGALDALDDIHNAGSVFVGPYSPVPVGDYVGGTNHILPSGGAARYSSGLGVGDFVKRIYVSGFERTALERFAPHVEALAEAEGLPGHARALQRRLES